MTTEEDRTAGSNYLNGRLVDLARAAYWARLMKDEQRYLNGSLDDSLDDHFFDEGTTVDQATAQLREEAVAAYMLGDDEDDPAEVSLGIERANRVVAELETIATQAGNLRSYAEYARYLIEPPVYVKNDPWDAKRSADQSKPDSLKGDPVYRRHLEPTVKESMVYLPALGGLDGHVQLGTLTGFHNEGVVLSVATTSDNMNVPLSFEDATKLVEQVQQLIRFHKSQHVEGGESK
jgi:hypothetical protein